MKYDDEWEWQLPESTETVFHAVQMMPLWKSKFNDMRS